LTSIRAGNAVDEHEEGQAVRTELLVDRGMEIIGHTVQFGGGDKLIGALRGILLDVHRKNFDREPMGGPASGLEVIGDPGLNLRR
jgi:hypothetical protein